MELVLFMVIAIVFFTLSSSSPNDEANKIRVIKCHEMDKPHDWTYHPETKRLTCTKCNYEAGSHE